MEKNRVELLSNISKVITKGTTPTTLGFEFKEEGINFLKIESFDENGGFIPDKVAYIDDECNTKLKRSQLQKNDILFSIAGAIGRVAIVSEDMLPANTNQALAIIRIVDESIYIPYVKLILMSSIVKRQIERQKQGVAQINLSLKNIGDLEIPLLSYDEQRHYVDLFNKIRKIISQRKEQLLLLDDLVKSRFVEMFGDPVSNPMGWKKSRLGIECEIVTGNTPSRKISEYYGDYIEWIKSDNITSKSSYLTTAKEYLSEEGLKVGRSVEEGSILMTCIAGSIRSIANVAIADRKVSFNQQINAIVPKKNNTWFMYLQFIMSQEYIRSTINMSLKGILSKGTLSDLEFVFPPLQKQIEFADFVQHVDKLKVEVQKSLDETQVLFNSLMQEYFE